MNNKERGRWKGEIKERKESKMGSGFQECEARRGKTNMRWR